MKSDMLPCETAKEMKMTPYEKINKTLTANFLRDMAALMLKYDVDISADESPGYPWGASVVVTPLYTNGREGWVDIDGIGSSWDAEDCKAAEQVLRDEIAAACAIERGEDVTA